MLFGCLQTLADCEEMGKIYKSCKGVKRAAGTRSECKDFYFWFLSSWGRTICLIFLFLKKVVIVCLYSLFYITYGLNQYKKRGKTEKTP